MVERFYVKFGDIAAAFLRYRAEKQTDRQTDAQNDKRRLKSYSATAYAATAVSAGYIPTAFR